MNIGFVNTTTINNLNFTYKELKVKHLKVIYKSLIGNNPDPKIVINNFNNIINELTDISQDNFTNFSFVNYFLILLELRCTSIGDTIFAELTDKKNTKIEININKFIDVLKKINYNNLLMDDSIDNFKIIYKLPTIAEYIDINKAENLDNLYVYFIDKIICNNLTINFKQLSFKTSLTVLEQLPAKITATALKKVYDIIEYFNQINLLSESVLKDKTLIFNFNINNFIFLLKLIFGDQLMSLYDNIFVLCRRSNFTPEYIENCTPGEYFLYMKKLEALTPRQQTKDPDINQNELDPFSDLPPIISRSEFTP